MTPASRVAWPDARPPEGPAAPVPFVALYLGPLSESFDSNDRRALLDFCAPNSLAQRLRQGARTARDAYAGALSRRTIRRLEAACSQAGRDLETMQPLWTVVDKQEHHEVWEDIGHGFFSKESDLGAGVGAQLGGLLLGNPLLGHIAGRLVAGVAGQRDARARRTDEYLRSVAWWYERVNRALTQEILPSFQRDEARRAAGKSPDGAAAIVAVAGASVLVAAGAGWLFFVRAPSRQDTASATTASSVVPSSPLPSTEIAAPSATWTAVSKPVAPLSKPALSPVRTAPVSRGPCLRTCVGKCQDDPDCERTCAAQCPLP